MVDLSYLRTVAAQSITKALIDIPGSKTLILTRQTSEILTMVLDLSTLKQYGVESMFWLSALPFRATTPHVIFLTRPDIPSMAMVASSMANTTKSTAYSLLMMPRVSHICLKYLEFKGTLSLFHNIDPVYIGFLPLDNDVISLQSPCVRDLYIHPKDKQAVLDTATALLDFQKVHGLFPSFVGKGDLASKCISYAVHLRKEARVNEAMQDPVASTSKHKLNDMSSSFDACIVLERGTDFIATLMQQRTYAGALDEYFGIHNCSIEIPAPSPSNINSSVPLPNPVFPERLARKETKFRRHDLRKDPVYTVLKDKPWQFIGQDLGKMLRDLQIEQQRVTSNTANKSVKELAEMTKMIARMSEQKAALETHISLFQILKPHLESSWMDSYQSIEMSLLSGADVSTQISHIQDLIAQQAPMLQILRLIALVCVINDGMKTKLYDTLKREFCQAYGYKELLFLLLMEKMGIIYRSSITSAFSSYKKQLRLLVDVPSAGETQFYDRPIRDVSYSYLYDNKAYAPTLVRMVQAVAQKASVVADPPMGTQAAAHPIIGWRGFEDIVKLIPGEESNVVQSASDGDDDEVLSPKTEKSILVVIIGGITYGELASIRLMNSQSSGRKFVIATTNMINGDGMIRGLMPENENTPPP